MKSSRGRYLRRFLLTSTIHGFPYLVREKSRIVKTVWFLVVLLGAGCMVGQLVHQFKDWANYPTYLALESTAVPVSSIPFPSVTIFQDGGDPVSAGGWGYLGKQLDQMPFADEDSGEPTAFGRGFAAEILGASTDVFVEAMLGHLEARTSHEELESFLLRNHDGNSFLHDFRPFLDASVPVLCLSEHAGFLGYDSYLALVKESFGFTHLDDFLDVILKMSNSTAKTTVAANATSCDDRQKRLLLTAYNLLKPDERTSHPLGIGSLASHMAHFFGSGSFRKVDREAYAKRDSCASLSKLEWRMHDYFAKIGGDMGIGGGGGTNISLFELPVLLEGTGKQLYAIRTWSEYHPQFTCQQMIGLDYPANSLLMDFYTCEMAWGGFLGIHMFVDVGEVPMPCTRETEAMPANSTAEHVCCRFRGMAERGELNLTSVMKVMKFAKRRGQSVHKRKDLENHSAPTSNLSSPLYRVNAFETNVEPDDLWDFETIAPYCKFKLTEASSFLHFGVLSLAPICTALRPAVTNKGISYGFNTMDAGSLLSDSQFKTSFLEAYRGDFEVFAKDHHNPLQMGTKTGELEIYLDRQTMLSPEFVIKREEEEDIIGGLEHNNFYVSISDLDNSFDLGSQKTRIRLGYHTQIEVSVKELLSSKEVQNVPVEKRNCRFRQEVPPWMSIFKVYTQNLCSFECRLKVARQAFRCTPWNYPFSPEVGPAICDSYGKSCFQQYLNDNNETSLECECPEDCEKLAYSFSEKEWPLDAKKFCRKGSRIFASAFERLKWSKPLYRITQRLSQGETFPGNIPLTSHHSTDDAVHFCREALVKDMAVVSVKMASGVYERSVIKLKQTSSDKIASIGGTLGLFIGASFTSLFEIVFWIVKYLRERAAPKKGKAKKLPEK